jgi:hypothetical protein
MCNIERYVNDVKSVAHSVQLYSKALGLVCIGDIDTPAICASFLA